MIIDVGAHFYPSGYLKHVNREVRVPPHFMSDPSYVDPEFRIKLMDRYGVDIEILTWDSYSADALNVNDPVALARMGNDAYAELCKKYPDRFVGVANVPLQRVDSAIDELDRCVRDLGFKGVHMVTNQLGRPLDSEEFFPFYEKVVKLDVPIVTHPVVGNYHDWLRQYTLDMIWGWPFDTTLAMSRLVFGGVLEKFPTLKVVTHHGGAMVPSFVDRIKGFYDQTLDGSQPRLEQLWPVKLRKHPVEYFKLFYNDTALNGYTPGLMLAYRFFGPDRLLHGSDYPFGPEKGDLYLREGVRSIREMEIPSEEKERILEKNAKELFKIE